MKEPKKKNMTVLIQKYLYKKKHNQGDKSLLISRKMVYDDGQGWLIKTHHSLKKYISQDYPFHFAQYLYTNP